MPFYVIDIAERRTVLVEADTDNEAVEIAHGEGTSSMDWYGIDTCIEDKYDTSDAAYDEWNHFDIDLTEGKNNG